MDASKPDVPGLVIPAQGRLSRRALLTRVAPAAVLAATAFTPFARSADAGIRWCQIDPLIRVGGREARIYLAAAEQMLSRATAPVNVQVIVPHGVSYEWVPVDNGFGHGYNVWFGVNAGLRVGQYVPVQVGLVCPAWDASIPVHVDWVPGKAGAGTRSADGWSNTWISFDARM